MIFREVKKAARAVYQSCGLPLILYYCRQFGQVCHQVTGWGKQRTGIALVDNGWRI